MIEREEPQPSVRRQCELLRVSRSGLYYEPERTGLPSMRGERSCGLAKANTDPA